jgi:hypothetical protein
MERISKLTAALEQYSDRTPQDEQLCQLILTICSQPRDSLQRRKSMERLLLKVQRLPNLSKSFHPDALEAVNKTWEWLDNNLHNFHPRSSPIRDSLVTWINGYLRYRIRDLYAAKPKNMVSLDIRECRQFYHPCLGSFDAYIEQLEAEENQSLARNIAQYINRDPDAKLRKCYPKNRPDCNCQIIVQRLFLQQSPEKLSAIARQLNINTQTIHSFWRRTGFPKVRAIALEIAQINSDVMSG